LEILHQNEPTKAEREEEMLRNGFPAYTTSTAWLGYDDEKLRRLCREAVEAGWTHLKMKVGVSLEDDTRRAAIMREEIGSDRKLMMDANQVWDVGESIENISALQRVRSVVDRGTNEPRRRFGARPHSGGRLTYRRRHWRALPESHPLQTVLTSERHQFLPVRRLPPGRCKRGPLRSLDGEEVRRPGLPTRGWRGLVRVRSAPLDLRLHQRERVLWRTVSWSTWTTSTNTS
jgi:hypothetical protein